MTDEGVAAELAIQRLLAEYCHLVDDGELAALVDLFTADGELEFGGRTAHGPDALLEFFAKRQGRPEQRGRHLTLNTVVDLGDGTARAVSDYVHLVARDGAPVPALAGRYHDDFVLDDGRWRLRRRVIEPWPAPVA